MAWAPGAASSSYSAPNSIGLTYPLTMFALLSAEPANTDGPALSLYQGGVGDLTLGIASNYAGAEYPFYVDISASAYQLRGTPRFVVGVSKSASSHELYIDGVLVGTSSTSYATPSAAFTLGFGISRNINWVFSYLSVNANVGLCGIFNRALLPAEVRELYDSLAKNKTRAWVPVTAGGGGVNLVATTTTENNTSSTSAVSQTHALTAAPTSQANSCAAAIITQDHALTAAPTEQANGCAAASVTQDHVLSGVASTQAATASSAAIIQWHQLGGAPSDQANTSSIAAIVGGVLLSGSPASQANTSSADVITQGHGLVGATSSQGNQSSTGALDGSITLTGSACSQNQVLLTGAITQSHALVMAPSVQDNIAAASSVVQGHLLFGSAASQLNQCASSGLVPQPVVAVGGFPSLGAQLAKFLEMEKGVIRDGLRRRGIF